MEKPAQQASQHDHPPNPRSNPPSPDPLSSPHRRPMDWIPVGSRFTWLGSGCPWGRGRSSSRIPAKSRGRCVGGVAYRVALQPLKNNPGPAVPPIAAGARAPSGGGGIRTHEGQKHPYALSRRAPSSTRPPLPTASKNYTIAWARGGEGCRRQPSPLSWRSDSDGRSRRARKLDLFGFLHRPDQHIVRGDCDGEPFPKVDRRAAGREDQPEPSFSHPQPYLSMEPSERASDHHAL